ncbi:MAG: hypothetical protein ACPH5P_00185 [Akkermansiaceae bacterium]
MKHKPLLPKQIEIIDAMRNLNVHIQNEISNNNKHTDNIKENWKLIDNYILKTLWN